MMELLVFTFRFLGDLVYPFVVRWEIYRRQPPPSNFQGRDPFTPGSDRRHSSLVSTPADGRIARVGNVRALRFVFDSPFHGCDVVTGFLCTQPAGWFHRDSHPSYRVEC